MASSEFIKRPNIDEEYNAQQIQELKRCAEDPVYFINNYCWIQNQMLGKVKFTLRPYQEKIIRSLHENRFNILLIGRQCGKCFSSETVINTCVKPTGFKKFLLRIFFQKQYRIMYDD